MNAGVTENAKSDQVFRGIISERAAKTKMMNLQLASTTAILASPAVAPQDLATKLCVGFGIEFESRAFWKYCFHAVCFRL